MRVLLLQTLALAALVAAPAHADRRQERSEETAAAALQRVRAANANARALQSNATFDGARSVYAYQPGALYPIYANPGFVTALMLEPGESLNAIAAGDTARWTVTQAEAGDVGVSRMVVLIKPHEAGLRTNIVLVTDRRLYLLEALSEAGETYAAEVTWTYPRDAAAPVQAAPAEPMDSNYRVRIVRGRAPAWTPVRVFDNGAKTWIQFPRDVAATDLPPLFVITGDGAELVNYRVQDSSYMVDRLFDVAELRLGSHDPVIVRIERHPAPPRRSSPHRGRHP